VHGIDIAPDGRTVWVGGSAGNDPLLGTVTAVDTGSLEILDSIQLSNRIAEGERGANHIAFDPEGEKVYVSTFDGVTVIASATRAVLDTMATGAEPHEQHERLTQPT
jgi:DNA-binding beta-propeller fold protein YncE